MYNESRGLTDQEFQLFKEIMRLHLYFDVKLQHHKEKYLDGMVSIKPTKKERYYWNKSQFSQLLELLKQMRAEYNRVGVPDHLIHSVNCNGITYLRFRVDTNNQLFFSDSVSVQ